MQNENISENKKKAKISKIIESFLNFFDNFSIFL